MHLSNFIFITKFHPNRSNRSRVIAAETDTLSAKSSSLNSNLTYFLRSKQYNHSGLHLLFEYQTAEPGKLISEIVKSYLQNFMLIY